MVAGFTQAMQKYYTMIRETEKERMGENRTKTMVLRTIIRAGKILLNYFKLFLIPFVFIFMVFALIVKGIGILFKKVIGKATV